MGLRKARENVGDFLNFLEESRTSETGKEETKYATHTIYIYHAKTNRIDRGDKLGAEY